MRDHVDPSLLPGLDMMPSLDFTDESLPAIRQAMEQMSALAPEPEGTGVAWREESVPAEDGRAIPVRVYTPAGADGRQSPGILHIHGGGYIVGSVQTNHSWNILLAADAAPAGSVDAQNFATVLGEVWPKVEAQLLQDDQLGLLVNLGLAARWQRMPLFAKLADACMFGKRPPLIALIASPLTPDNRPVLDGEAVPVTINTTDYGRIPRAWLENAHRTHGSPAGKTSTKSKQP